jgi:hydroxypyruvate reductase
MPPRLDLKQLARGIFRETLGSLDIPAAMQRKLHREGMLLFTGKAPIDLSRFSRICVVAIGKAAHAMVNGLAAILPEPARWEGIVSAPVPAAKPWANLRYFVGGHPTPNNESWNAAQAILSLLDGTDERTLVFFLLSGGGSALVELPLDPSQILEDLQQLHRALVTCGASIDEINTVRKHLSAVKGGRLAVAAPAATKITLAVSDVPAGKESALASGPTIPDPTTLTDFRRIVASHHLSEKFPPSLQRWLAARNPPETPKPAHPAFANASFSLLLGVDDLFHPAHHAAEALGFLTCCDNSTDDWPVERAAAYLLSQLEELRKIHPKQRVAIIADGELSSPVTGDGVGGRNAAFVLACVDKIAGRQMAVLSAGTDGMDGNSPAAGAVADGQTLSRAAGLGLDPAVFVRRSDAYSFFARLDDTIVTGPTGTNLRDLRVLVAEA